MVIVNEMENKAQLPWDKSAFAFSFLKNSLMVMEGFKENNGAWEKSYSGK